MLYCKEVFNYTFTLIFKMFQDFNSELYLSFAVAFF